MEGCGPRAAGDRPQTAGCGREAPLRLGLVGFALALADAGAFVGVAECVSFFWTVRLMKPPGLLQRAGFIYGAASVPVTLALYIAATMGRLAFPERLDAYTVWVGLHGLMFAASLDGFRTDPQALFRVITRKDLRVARAAMIASTVLFVASFIFVAWVARVSEVGRNSDEMAIFAMTVLFASMLVLASVWMTASWAYSLRLLLPPALLWLHAPSLEPDRRFARKAPKSRDRSKGR
jgi:hypothetical protein